MKKAITVLSFCFLICSALIGKEPWNDVNVFRINKEAPAAFMTTFSKFADAIRPINIDDIANINCGDSYRLLNGEWKFFFANSRKDVRPEFFDKKFDDSSWNNIDVPCSWQNRGYDNIFYTNMTLQFMYSPTAQKWQDMLPDFLPTGKKRSDVAPAALNPYIPEAHQQAGIYRRTFSIPSDWNNKRVFVKFCGVRTGFKLFVNGKFVGYSEDSFTPAEFDLTKYILPNQTNTMAVEVYKYTTGSYYEMQDMPHMMGITRDVVLIARPNVYVRDYYVRQKLSPNLKEAELNFEVELRNTLKEKADDITLSAWLVNSDGTLFSQKPLFKKQIDSIPENNTLKIKEKVEVENFKLWYPDKPNYYALCFKLTDKNKKELESVRADFAFRQFKIVGKHLEINNTPILIKGVNHHDWSPDKGKTMDFHYVKKDMELMKRCNINFVRTSHYPKDDSFYMLCTRYGIGILDENNHEMHAFMLNSAMDLPVHLKPSIDRMENMVMRDRNVPCVFMFSVGNESANFYTIGHKALEKVVRSLSPDHYFFSQNECYDIQNERAHSTSDFFGPMYEGIVIMSKYLKLKNETRPFFFCEYAHCMGNALGNLKGKWDMIRSHESLNGGFIWDWVDQTVYLPRKDKPSEKYLSDGRHWKTNPSFGNFSANGIIFADRTYSAKYNEVRHIYADIRIESNDPKGPFKLKITNEFTNTNLNEFIPRIKIYRDGILVGENTLDTINLAPAKSLEFTVNLPEFEDYKIGEYFYTLEFVRKNGTCFSPRESVIASNQFFFHKINSDKIKYTKNQIIAQEAQSSLTLTVGKTKVIFDKNISELVSYTFDNKKLIESNMKFDVKSAWIDNYKMWLGPDFEKAGYTNLKLTKNNFEWQQLEDSVKVVCSQTLETADKKGFENTFTFILRPNGNLEVSAKSKKLAGTPESIRGLPRIGVRMGINKEFDNVEYLGRGPFANYCDRYTSAFVGRYKSKVADWFEKFTRPQDTGNREDVRWLSLKNKNGYGLLISAQPKPLPMSVLPYTQEEISKASSPHLLPETEQTDLRIAYQVAGLGNNSCGHPPRDQHLIKFKDSVEWKFSIIPIVPNDKFSQTGIVDKW